MKDLRKPKKHEALLWSIALPGFGQILNGSLFKGCVFIFLEILVNVLSQFNLAIFYSFQGVKHKPLTLQTFNGLCFTPVYTCLPCGMHTVMQTEK